MKKRYDFFSSRRASKKILPVDVTFGQDLQNAVLIGSGFSGNNGIHGKNKNVNKIK